MNLTAPDRLTIQLPVLGAVGIDVCTYTYPEPGSENTLKLIFFDRNRLIEMAFKILESEAFDKHIDENERQRARNIVGRRIWSRLHPDIGDGREKSLGSLQVDFKDFKIFIRKYYHAKTIWDALAQVGKDAWPRALPTYSEWNFGIHFAEKDLPSPADIKGAEQVVAELSGRLWEEEQEQFDKPGAATWSGADFDRRLTRLALKYERKPGPPERMRKAFSLVSYRERARFGNWIARCVMSELPEGLLDEMSMRVFIAMYIAVEDRVDERGRIEIPLMASPALSSMIEFAGEFNKTINQRNKKIKSRQWIIDDLLAFMKSGKRNRGLDVMLGFGRLYQPWLATYRLAATSDKQQKRSVRELLLRPGEDFVDPDASEDWEEE